MYSFHEKRAKKKNKIVFFFFSFFHDTKRRNNSKILIPNAIKIQVDLLGHTWSATEYEKKKNEKENSCRLFKRKLSFFFTFS
jgi:hypothetical protein